MADKEMIGRKKGKRHFEYYASDINEHINWERIHTVMVALNWCWFFGKDEFSKDNMGIPNVTTIKNYAYRLLKTAYEEECQISSGGFTAGWDDGSLYLEFTVEEWTVD